MAAYAAELQQLHTVFSHVDAGLTSSGGVEAESFLRNTEDLVDELRDNAELLAGDGGHNNQQTHIILSTVTYSEFS